MSKEAMKLALEAAYLAGFHASGEGYNGEYPFNDQVCKPQNDANWVKNRDDALREALAEQPAQQEPVISTAHGPWIPSTHPGEEGESYCKRCLLRDKFLGSRQCDPHIVPPEQPAQQESVGYVAENGVVDWNICAPPIMTDLYTSPPQRKPLTDEEIIASNYPDGEENGPTIAAPDFELICFARQIEAKLKEKNNG